MFSKKMKDMVWKEMIIHVHVTVSDIAIFKHVK